VGLVWAADRTAGPNANCATAFPGQSVTHQDLVSGARDSFDRLRGGGLLLHATAPRPDRTRYGSIADFDNRTGDPAFDYTLKKALAIDLHQSPFLAILSDQQVADTLRLMLRGTDQRVTRDLAQGVCQRTGSKAVLSGSIASLGSEYVIGLTATDCENGEPLAQEQVRARRKEEVLDGVDKLAFVLRRKLGESLRSIQRYERPIHEALSTVSLNAFQAYADGERIVRRRGNAAAIPFFKRAIGVRTGYGQNWYIEQRLARQARASPEVSTKRSSRGPNMLFAGCGFGRLARY